MAEIVRGGLNSIPKSQFEAAQSQGFGFFQSMRLIILPQTFRLIIPALDNSTTVVKDSSYLAGINVAEFMYTSKVIMATTTSLDQILLVYGSSSAVLCPQLCISLARCAATSADSSPRSATATHPPSQKGRHP